MTTRKEQRRIKIKYRVRNKISGSAARPRLSVSMMKLRRRLLALLLSVLKPCPNKSRQRKLVKL